MDRRQFIRATAAASIGLGGASTVNAELLDSERPAISELVAYSTSSLLDSNYRELTDDETVAVWAAGSASNSDANWENNAWEYDEETPIPLVAVDGSVVGLGSTFVDDENGLPADNATFVENVWDAKLDDGATVLWDESHNQYWSLDKFSEFERRVEAAGYSLESTYELTDDLDDADGLVIAVPRWSFWDRDLDALASFVADGGVLFLVNQSDYRNYDETGNLNEICERLGLSFRFNDDQVYDNERNAGRSYEPATGQFNDSFPFFDDSDGGGGGGGGGGEDPVGEVVDVLSVDDGDTISVDFNGTKERVRILGHDTPETRANRDAERPAEWEGIDSLDTLGTWGANASQFGKDRLSGETVELRFDENADRRDPFDRLLAYVYYDATGDGSRDTLYNLEAVKEGYARVYDSVFTRHDEFLAAELEARANDRGLWSESAPEESEEIRNEQVDELFVPDAGGVGTTAGALPEDRTPVVAEAEASWNGPTNGDGIPLVGVDESAGVAMVGGPLVDETYETKEGFPVDTSSYGNFAFLTNLIDWLSEREGDVLIDGGHGQFGAEYALSAEDTAYYQRYLEGVGIGFEGINNLDGLDRGRALLVTTPVSSFTDDELAALRSFRDNGGAIVLLGSGGAPGDARSNLNDLAAGVGTDLRLGSGSVTDYENNLDGDRTVVTTTRFDTSFPLFDPV